MVLIIFGGFSGISGIDKEVQPTVKENAVIVSLPYPGAGPKEIEEQVCVRIEEAVDTLQGISKVTCVASQSLGVATIEAANGYPIERLLNEVKSRVDAISTFPVDSERPTIEQLIIKIQVLNIAVISDSTERGLKEYALQIKDELSVLPEIPEVVVQGTREYEVSVEVDENSLRQYSLSIDDIALAIRRHSINLGGGIIRTHSGEIQIQTRNQSYRGPDFEKIPVISNSDGVSLRIGDIAAVRDGFVDVPQVTRINGKRAVLLTINVNENPNVLTVAEAAKNYLKDRRATLPAEFELKIWQDTSIYFYDRLKTLVKNGLGGLLLVFIILLLFLRPALAIWVTVGISVAFIGSLWVLPIIGTSINVMTLFAYIMVLGIVVDDAIIIGESIYTQQQKGIYGVRSAQIGASMMAKPVFFAVLTSIMVFIPLLLLPGDWAYFMAPIAIIPILVLIFSLIESCLILPSHLAGMKEEGKPWFPAFRRLRNHIESGFRYFLIVHYRPFIRRCIINRGITIASFLVFFILSISTVAGGWVKLSLPPDVAIDLVLIEVDFTEGIPFKEMYSVAKHMEEAAFQAAEDLQGEGEPFILSNIFIHASGNHLTAMTELIEEQYRTSGTIEFSHLWQKKIGLIAQAETVKTFDKVTFEEADLQLRLSGANADELEGASEWLQKQLSQIDGMVGIQDNLFSGRPELEIRPKESASNFGVHLQDIARQMRQVFYGEEVQRIPRGREDVKVLVRYPEQVRNDINSLSNLRIRTSDGREVPFSAVADSNFANGYAKITRVNGRTQC